MDDEIKPLVVLISDELALSALSTDLAPLWGVRQSWCFAALAPVIILVSIFVSIPCFIISTLKPPCSAHAFGRVSGPFGCGIHGI